MEYHKRYVDKHGESYDKTDVKAHFLHADNRAGVPWQIKNNDTSSVYADESPKEIPYQAQQQYRIYRRAGTVPDTLLTVPSTQSLEVGTGTLQYKIAKGRDQCRGTGTETEIFCLSGIGMYSVSVRKFVFVQIFNCWKTVLKILSGSGTVPKGLQCTGIR
jgi:hypothetical protein